jgi:hypothetical protein
MTNNTNNQTAMTAPTKFKPIRWLLCLDAAYRQAHNLKNADDRILEDMGVTRQQVNSLSIIDLANAAFKREEAASDTYIPKAPRVIEFPVVMTHKSLA